MYLFTFQLSLLKPILTDGYVHPNIRKIRVIWTTLENLVYSQIICCDSPDNVVDERRVRFAAKVFSYVLDIDYRVCSRCSAEHGEQGRRL